MDRISRNGNIFCLMIVFLTTTSLASDIYKWVDKDGKIHFGAKPPDESAVKVEVRNPNTLDRLDAVLPIQENANRDYTPVTSQEFKSFYRDKQLKFQYKTVGGMRVNPTYEYYSWGDLKRKITYPKNLLDSPISIKGFVTIDSISVHEEFLDSITFDLTYQLHRTTRGSRVFLQMGYEGNHKTKSMGLLPGKTAGQVSARLKVKINEPYESDEILVRIYDHHRDKWSTVERLRFIKIWGSADYIIDE